MEQTQFPRHYVFVAQDGRIVVRLGRGRVWDLENHQTLPYHPGDYGHAITDGELRQLREGGQVDSYDTHQVRFTKSLPAPTPPNQSNRVQGYYIVTALPASQLGNMRAVLPGLGIPYIIQPEVRHGFVVILGRKRVPFPTLHDAEDLLQQLVQAAPNLFHQSFVSMSEVALHRDELQNGPEAATSSNKQSGVSSPVAGKRVGLVGEFGAEENAALRHVLGDVLDLHIYGYPNGVQAIPAIEDSPPTILIVNLQLPDMHGWAFIKKLREIPHLARLPIVVISDDASDMLLALKIVKVSAFISRPLDVDKLREKILLSFNNVT